MKKMRKLQPNRRLENVFLISILIFLLCGCAQSSNHASDSENRRILAGKQDDVVEIIVEDTDLRDRIVSDYTVTSPDSPLYYLNTVKEFTSADLSTREEAGLTEDALGRIMSESGRLYCYSMLDAHEKQLYAEILFILQNLQKEVLVCSMDADSISKAFQCVMSDHPEIFYVEGYTYTMHNREDELLKITFSGNYTKTADQIRTCQIMIDSTVDAWLAGIPSNADDYAKVKYVYEYVILNTEYEINSLENQNICSVFIYHSSVCQGYAKAVQYLLNKLQIPCTLVIGDATSGNRTGSEGHAWNLVMIDNEYYYLDATWGDSSYSSNGQELSQYPPVCYDYLCVTTDEISKSHQFDNPVSMPWCYSVNANYYYREGLYFDTLDYNRLAQAFSNAYNSGQAYVMIKCSEDVYAAMIEELFTNEHIFDFMASGSRSVSYSENEEQGTLCIWI